MSDGGATISFRYPRDFSIARTIAVHDGATPITRLNELEYAHGLIFANIWQQDRIAIIDPADGTVLSWIELGALINRFDKPDHWDPANDVLNRSEEHTSELQSLMRISYAVFCLKKKKNKNHQQYIRITNKYYN